MPPRDKHAAERGRLMDAYVDGHKYIFGKRAMVYGEEDLVVGITAFLAEIGVKPVLCASGGQSGNLEQAMAEVTAGLLPRTPVVREGADFYDIAEEAEELGPICSSATARATTWPRRWNVPLVRVGLPHPRPLRRPAHPAPGLSRRPESFRPHRQRHDSNTNRRPPVGYGYHVKQDHVSEGRRRAPTAAETLQ